jgi:hypothetical protein
MSIQIQKGISVFLFLWSFSLIIGGVFFDVQINSGPPLIIYSGQSLLKLRMGDVRAEEFNYATTDYELFSSNGFKRIGPSFAYYSVIGSETTDMGEIRVPKLHITTMYPAPLVILVFLGSFISSGYLFIRYRKST